MLVWTSIISNIWAKIKATSPNRSNYLTFWPSPVLEFFITTFLFVDPNPVARKKRAVLAGLRCFAERFEHHVAVDQPHGQIMLQWRKSNDQNEHKIHWKLHSLFQKYHDIGNPGDHDHHSTIFQLHWASQHASSKWCTSLGTNHDLSGLFVAAKLPSGEVMGTMWFWAVWKYQLHRQIPKWRSLRARSGSYDSTELTTTWDAATPRLSVCCLLWYCCQQLQQTHPQWNRRRPLEWALSVSI